MKRSYSGAWCAVCLTAGCPLNGPFVNGALSEVFQTELNDFRNVKTGQRKAVAVGVGGIQDWAALGTSVFGNACVAFIDRALSEVSQAELYGQRNIETVEGQAVAVGFGAIQDRARLFFIVLVRYPCGEIRHDRQRLSAITE